MKKAKFFVSNYQAPKHFYICKLGDKNFYICSNKFDICSFNSITENGLKDCGYKKSSKKQILGSVNQFPPELEELINEFELSDNPQYKMSKQPKFRPGDLINWKYDGQPRRIISVNVNKNTYLTKLDNSREDMELGIDYVDSAYTLASNNNNNNNKTMNPPDLTKDWQYQIDCQTPEILKVVINYLNSLGMKGNVEDSCYKAVCINFKSNWFSANSRTNNSNFGEVITFNDLFSPEFVSFYEESKKPKFVEVTLNQDYTAKVYKDKVVVGCQEFKISAIQDVLAARSHLV